MDSSETLRALLGIAEEIGIQVRLAPATAEWGGAPGGTRVRLKGREILFLNTSAPLADQLEAAAVAHCEALLSSG
ncbi:MAG: hypothetical protein ACOC93_03900, partial [Planctomycetota bacterium]